MALFQSGPYQSKMVSGIVRQSRRWLEWGAIAWRRCRTAASWTAQILLYPVYAVFQASRGLRSRVDLWLTGGSEPIAPWAETASTEAEQAALAVDAPVYGILQTLREMALPGSLPVVLDEAIAQSDNIFYPVGPVSLGSWALPTGPSGLVVQRLATMLGQAPEQTLRQGTPTFRPSESSLVPTASSRLTSSHPSTSSLSTSSPSTSPYQVQGIASRLDTRALVLVTTQNQVLDILSHAQQSHLRQRLIWELATHGRRVQLSRQQTRAWLQSYGPIQPRARQLLGRWAQRLMGWMQQSSVAIAANLFQESMLQQSRELSMPHQPSALSFTRQGQPLRAQDRASAITPSAITPSAISAAALSMSAMSAAAITPSPTTQVSPSHAPTIELREAAKPSPDAAKGDPTPTTGVSAIPYPPPTAASGPRSETGPGYPLRIPYPPPVSAGAVPTHPRHEADYIDTQASVIQYLRTPLEGCLRWLDRVFVWLETKLAALWHSQ